MSSINQSPTVDDAPKSSSKNSAHLNIEGQGSFSIIGRTVTINRDRNELFAFWRNFENLPRFMENVTKVVSVDQDRSHWVIEAPGDRTVEWDAVITDEEPGSLIAWRSVEGADINNRGSIAFRDSASGRGTEVTATILYEPPMGTIGKLIAKIFQKEPNIQVRRDLRRFKQLMETGEISTAKPPKKFV